jgi:ABC-2 type transport system permease protein
MTNVATIMRKELKSYLLSPVFYFVAFFFLIISGGWFFTIVTHNSPPDLSITFRIMVYLLFPLCPVLTMHLFADERRSGTIELLMTYPLRDWEVVIGKYLASLMLFLLMVVLTVEFPAFLYAFGKPDLGPVLTNYLGFILLGASFLAVGILGSALSKSQMLASVISFTIVFGLMILGLAGNLLGTGRLRDIMEFLPGTTHYEQFAAGLVDSRDLLFFFSFILFCLFTAVRVVEIKRWK